MGRVKDHYHDEICARAAAAEGERDDPIPSQLEMLREAKNVAMGKWIDLIRTLPAVSRNSEQAAEIEAARVAALAARDAYWTAGGI